MEGDLASVLGIELSGLRWVVGPAASARLRQHGLLAATRGRTVVVDGPRFALLPYAARRRVLAHELVHVLQQTEGARWIRRDDSPGALEAEADLVGRHAAIGRPSPVRRRDDARLAARWQGHDSFEHRLLGDTPTNLLNALVAGQGPTAGRDSGLESACALLDYLGCNPTSLDPARVSQLAGFPVRLVTLTGSQLAVTYGELNTMADFLTSPEEIDSLPQAILLPILQMVRHQGWTKLNALRTRPAQGPDFSSGLLNVSAGSVNAILETAQLDALTRGLGPSGRDHYQGSLARNACHFAPYTWARWRASYAVAAATALRAYHSRDPETTRLAWLAHGYADHFLQDSFAAGHLVNKTLVMQWFLEGAASTSLPVYDWDTFHTLTVANQPGLTNWTLYDPDYTGISNDPQTTEELPTVAERRANSGVIAAAGLSLDQAYQAYLAMLDSPVVQIVTNQLHDVLNGRSVTVGSARQSDFVVWGDDTMLNGGVGAGLASEAAQLSQKSIADILATGGSKITLDAILAQFPTQVASKGAMISLRDWHAVGGELWDLCRSDLVFNSTVTWAFGGGSYLMPTMGTVSVDQSSSWVPPAGTAPFSTADAGKTHGVSLAEVGCLQPGASVSMNGNTDLSGFIVGNSNAKVYSIKLAKQSGIIYDYVISVVAEGPRGFGSGWLNLYFTDRTGDRYSLGIWKSDKLQHTVAYNSKDPGIVKIEWGD